MSSKVVKSEDAYFKEEASKRWKALLKLDANAERIELAEAGVAPHTIQMLYPYSFTDLVPGICTLSHSIEPWRMAAGEGRSIWEALRFELDEPWTKRRLVELEQWQKDPHRFKLQARFYEIAEGPYRNELSREIEYSLWSACWFMTYEPELQLGSKVYQHFVTVFDWAMPKIVEHSATLFNIAPCETDA